MDTKENLLISYFMEVNFMDNGFLGTLALTSVAIQYGIKISVEVDGNAKKPKAYLKLFKNFGPTMGSRSKKIEYTIEQIQMITMQEILAHVSQFIHPIIGF